MENTITIHDQVRENTPEEINTKQDNKLSKRLLQYQGLSKDEITYRLVELRKEWDIERALEVNASSLALASLMLGTFVNRRWYVFTGIVAGFLLQHGIQGWCPPVPLFRAMGVRTRKEIDEEIYALKILRGDFDNISSSSSPTKILKKFRK